MNGTPSRRRGLNTKRNPSKSTIHKTTRITITTTKPKTKQQQQQQHSINHQNELLSSSTTSSSTSLLSPTSPILSTTTSSISTSSISSSPTTISSISSPPTSTSTSISTSPTSTKSILTTTLTPLQSITLLTTQKRLMAYKLRDRAPKRLGKEHPLPGKKPAVDPNQIQMGLTRRAETALQMVHDGISTTNKTKSVHKISQLERTVKNKLEQLEMFLSHDITNYNLGEILSIYNTFKEVRFAASPMIWSKIMQMWVKVGRQQSLDEVNKNKALTVALELFDEVNEIDKMGVFTVMKRKNANLPEHLVQFNIRPNSSHFTQAMTALSLQHNHEGILQLFDTHQNMLNSIPDVQYLPTPLLPEGPEKEQEFVSRKLMAQRRQELIQKPILDSIALDAAQKLGDFDRVNDIMYQMMTKRAYEPHLSAVNTFQIAQLQSTAPLSSIIFFKEHFQAFNDKDTTTEFKPLPTQDELIQKKQQLLDELTSKHYLKKTTTLLTDEAITTTTTSTDTTTDTTTTTDSTTIPQLTTYTIPILHKPMTTDLPEFMGHPNTLRSTLTPTRQNWTTLFRAIATLHPDYNDTTTSTTTPTTTTTNQEPNTTSTSLIVSPNTNIKNEITLFITSPSNTLLLKNKQFRHHLYKVAREQYGITIDKSFFLPMIQEAQSYDEVLVYLDDFHEELESLRTKFKKNPWTEDELKQQEREKKLKSMLVVNLNVTGHDHRMKHLFGRYMNDAKALGYDEQFYGEVQQRLLHFLVDTYQRDALENNFDTSLYTNSIDDNNESYEIETFIDPNGMMQKIKKPKIDSETGQPVNLISTRRQSLFDIYRGDKSTDTNDNNNVSSLATSSKTNTITTKTKTSIEIDSEEFNNRINLPPALIKTELVKVVDRFNLETTQMLMSSTTRQRVKHILTSLQTVRAYQESYGLPVSSNTESRYLESLILMARRNEIYPPILATSDTSLIKYNVAPYIPSFDGESTSTLTSNTSTNNNIKPLMHFKDRINHIYQSLLRREGQIKLTLQELEHSIDALSTMKNETDEYGRLKRLNVKVLNDVIEALAELSIDASTLRGPFDQENIFVYNASAAHIVLGKIARGEDVPNMKIDKITGAKYVPGITEPHPHQIDRIDLEDYLKLSTRIHLHSFGEMKSALQKLIQYGHGMTPQQVQHISLLKPDEFGSLVTENTYLPLLRSCAAHGDYTNVLLLIESAHQHRDVIPTTKMLNYAAVAFLNSNRQRHAAGILDIMVKASKPENRKVRTITEHELDRAITHGTADELIQVVQNQLDYKVLPNAETISLLLRMYKNQGMLDHAEELWRRLTYHNPNSWTSFSAVEEQKMIGQILAAELDVALTPDHELFDEIRGTIKPDANEIPDLSMSINDVYDKALNPNKNRELRDAMKHDEVRVNLSKLLHNRTLESVLPHGAHRSDIPQQYRFTELNMDSASKTAMIQTFIQLGHPMHALQIYLDARESMPTFPIQTPKHSKPFQQARRVNRLLAQEKDLFDPNDSLTDFMLRKQGPNAITNALSDLPQQMLQDNNNDTKYENNPTLANLAIPITPSKRSFTTDKSLIVRNNGNIETDAMGVKVASKTVYNLTALTPKAIQLNTIAADQTITTIKPSDSALVNSATYENLMSGLSNVKQDSPFELIRQGQWPEVDALASIALYAYKKGEQYLAKMGANGLPIANIPPEVLEHAQLLIDASSDALSSLKRYTVDHPYLPGDPTTLLFFSNPGTLNNLVSPDSGTELTQPRLLLPFTDENEHIYRLIDAVVYSDIALEESVFKMRYKQLKPVGMQRWFTIFPTMINQCKAISQMHQTRLEINNKLDALRDDVEMLLATGRRKPKYVRVAEIIEEKRLTGQPLTSKQIRLIESQSLTASNPLTGRMDSAELNQIDPGSLRHEYNVEDRGISHPDTKQMINANFPSTPQIDLREFSKSATNNAWVSNFNSFLKDTKNTQQFLASISIAPAMDEAEKSKLKKKLLAQTKAADNTKGKDDNNKNKIKNVEKSIQTTEQQQNEGQPKFERWSGEKLDPHDPLFKLKLADQQKEQQLQLQQQQEQDKQKEHFQQIQQQYQQQHLPKDGSLPPSPLLNERERNVDGKKLIQQIKRELEEAHSGFGLYATKSIVGPDGKNRSIFGQIKDEDYLPTTNTPPVISEKDQLFKRAQNQLQQFNIHEKHDDKTQQQQLQTTTTGKSHPMSKFTTQPKKPSPNKNSLLLPEVQQMKQHLSDQAKAQRAIVERYDQRRMNKNNQQEDDDDFIVQSDVKVGGYSNQLEQMMASDLTLMKSYNNQNTNADNNTNFTTQPKASQKLQWLSSPTDLAVAEQVAHKHVKIAKQRFKPMPGVIDPVVHNLNEGAEVMAKLTSSDGTQETKPITRQRPGGIHTSPYGPQSFRPENQFRSPSTMAKLANTPETEIDRTKLAIDQEENNIKFTVATHGVGYSDRPGRPTHLSQEYLEQHLMGLGADPINKRSKALHQQVANETARSIMDPSFIKMGDPNATLTNRGGEVGPDGKRAETHQEGYGVGVHKFRERSKAKLTELAQKGTQALLHDFDSAAQIAQDAKLRQDGSADLASHINLEADFEKIPRKEREKLEYRNIFEMGGDLDEHGSRAMSRTGQYQMLTPEDRQQRDKMSKDEGFAALESQMDALFSKNTTSKQTPQDLAGQELMKSLATEQFDFTGKNSNIDTQKAKKIKQVFSSALQHTAKDYHGMGNKPGTKKAPNQSTLFD